MGGCQIRAGAFEDGASAAAATLGTGAFSDRMKSSIAEVLGSGDDALRGDLSLTSIAAWQSSAVPGGKVAQSWPSWAVWGPVGVAIVFLLLAAVCLVARRRKGHPGRS